MLHCYAPAKTPNRNPSMRQVVLLATCLMLTAGLISGCADGDTKDTMDPTDRTEKTWYLREPPTREQVGMKNDNTVIFETDAPRTVTLRLPEDTSLTLPLTLLTFDNYGRDPSGDNQNPTGLDGKTDRVPLDETVELYRSTLDQLHMGTDTIADFQKQASAADGAQHPAKRITSQRVEKKYGYMRLQVLAQYEPDTQVGYIKISGVWGPILKYGTSDE